MRAEISKLLTVRTPLLLLAVAQVVAVAAVSGFFVAGAPDPSDPFTGRRAVAHAGLMSIFSLILGILAVAGEYRHKTITDTYLSTPRRGIVVARKLAVYAVAGMGYGVVTCITAIATTAIWLSAQGGTFELSSSAVLSTLAGCVVSHACFAAIGVGIGALFRNVVGAVAGALAWLALVEGIVGQLLGEAGRWLPYRSGQALMGELTPGLTLLPQWGGGVVLVAYAAIFASVAVWTTVRRDVS